jgi:hypothetical protein
MQLFGNKEVSLFDIWSIEHFVAGVTLGSLLLIVMPKYFCNDLVPSEPGGRKDTPYSTSRLFLFNYFIIILLLSYIWEVLEFYMEAGYTYNEKITYWFQGTEYWLNRAVSDPLMVALGAWAAIKCTSRAFFWGMRSFSAVWVGVHVFVFPHCMHLQDMLYRAMPKLSEIQAKLSEAAKFRPELIWGLLG